MSEESNVSGDSNLQAAAAPNVYESDTLQAQGEGDHNVPLAALKAERSERQRLEDELRVLKDHVSLLQARQAEPQQSKPQDELDGLSDTDVLTVGEAKRFMKQFNNQFQTGLEEVKMTQRYPDYQEVVTKYLPEVLKTNPGLHRTLKSSNDYELAYYLAKNSEGYRKITQSNVRNADAERIVSNAKQAGSLSSFGGSVPISQAKRWKDMSDADFAKEAAKNRGYA